MSFEAEAQIVREIGKFLCNGGLYKGAKPVLWSVVEQTALAEAEVEYHDHRSNTVWVRFPIVTPSHPALDRRCGGDLDDDALDACPAIARSRSAPISTTPSCASMPSARRAALSPGEKLLVAVPLIEETAKQSGIEAHTVEARFPGTALAGTVARHPLHGQGYDFAVPLLAADFVAADTGTGLVHIAPGHGADDWELGQANGLPVPDTVGPDGVYLPNVPLFAGHAVYRPDGKPGDADKVVIEAVETGRRPPRPRRPGAFLPAFLAVEGAADLPQHAAMVHLDGGERVAREGAARRSTRPAGSRRRAATASRR